MHPPDFINFLGYRNALLEEKLEECLAAIQRGETEFSIDRGDLTDSEVEYLQEEIRRRIKIKND